MPHVGFRCTEAEKAALENTSRGNISGYLRELAFGDSQDQSALVHKLEDLREDIMQELQETQGRGIAGAESGSGEGFPGWAQAVLLEVLLMMRTQFKREAKNQAMGEVERLGMEPFDSNSFLSQRG